ncbi:MAG: hypothetical protein F4Y63_02845 [Chloroflexi bacterium]|nr:hypothetical protein [Chloroflexota bacterium]MYK60923.1 hypothetical protein [Chloroflexota bacterium]
MKSKMLGALALFTLIGALFVMQSAEQHTPTADASAGSIAAMNVGTCLTTDGTVFKGDCNALSKGVAGTGADGEDIRTKITEVSTLYATYAHDPKNEDEPRAILMNSDLLQISIADSDRDKRSGVLIRGESNTTAGLDDDDADSNPATKLLGQIIREDLDKDNLDYQHGDPDTTDGTPEDDIMFTSEDAIDDGIEVYQSVVATGTAASLIQNSGNYTLNFRRQGKDDGSSTNDAASPDWQFDPGDFKVDDGAVVRFYGCLDGDGAGADLDGDCADAGETIERLDELEVDEDASNGEASGDTAPWLGVNASVPTNKHVVILAIYYRTSDRENLIGGEAYWTCPDDSDDNKVSPTEKRINNMDEWRCDATSTDDGDPADERDGERNVVYTDNEQDRNTALKVTASSDGDDRSANLYLKETARFSGVYRGYLRLTDADGQGPDSDSVATGNQPSNWGLATMDGTDDTDTKGNLTTDSAAVLGVQSGPITIEYRDSDGKPQMLRIEIDAHPPTINVSSPAHGSSSDDQSPDFSGTIEDIDSGLADKSFRLVIDNQVDSQGKNSDYVLNENPVEAPTASEVKGTGDDGTGRVTHRGEYTGYADDDDHTVGVAMASDLYNLMDDSCSDQNLCHILAESYDDGSNRGTFDDSIRLDLRDGSRDAEIRDMEYEIDFQAFVLDMAGNIGFSDSDPANPRFINDLGIKDADRDKEIAKQVLGYYSAHVITLDEKDPDLIEEQTATGFYGLDSKGNPTIQDRSSVMVVFDGPIAASSVSNSTFSVKLDDGSAASVVDHKVDKKYVFLRLDSELASDATPMVDIVNGEKVEDMAGNETFGREQDEFEAKDGISPRLTVTLSGGSGSGTGNEGPEKLTKDTITIHVSSDEALSGNPRIAAVCSSLAWKTGGTPSVSGSVAENASGVVNHDIDDFVAAHNGSFSGKPEIETNMTSPRTGSAPSYQFTCGYDANPDDDFEDDFQWSDVPSRSRPGENWDSLWENQTGALQKLQDGAVTAVAFARDRSSYSKQNWGSASAEFTLDTKVIYPDPSGDVSKGGDLQPAPDGVTKEARPFVLIEFNEGTTVTLDSVELDGVEVASEFEQPDHNRFVYWPESLSQGDHEVEVEATDAAGNPASFSYEFETVARGDFVIGLNAGWNAISVPADPVDTAIGSVFTDPAITTVIGWDTQGWRIAMRRDGVWESNEKYGALNEIRAKYGYWVKSDGFVRQAVELKGGTSRDAGGTPILISIPTEPGWNFVGVVDQDGDQTEDHFGIDLRGSDKRFIPAGEYLGSTYVRAYTWDATFSRFDVVRPDDTMTIGDGVWVYYPEGTGIAP